MLLCTCSTLVDCTEESISTVYGLPVHHDKSRPYQALYHYQQEIRDSKSLLNTFPFNQEGKNFKQILFIFVITLK